MRFTFLNYHVDLNTEGMYEYRDGNYFEKGEEQSDE